MQQSRTAVNTGELNLAVEAVAVQALLSGVKKNYLWKGRAKKIVLFLRWIFWQNPTTSYILLHLLSVLNRLSLHIVSDPLRNIMARILLPSHQHFLPHVRNYTKPFYNNLPQLYIHVLGHHHLLLSLSKKLLSS